MQIDQHFRSRITSYKKPYFYLGDLESTGELISVLQSIREKLIKNFNIYPSCTDGAPILRIRLHNEVLVFIKLLGLEIGTSIQRIGDILEKPYRPSIDSFVYCENELVLPMRARIINIIRRHNLQRFLAIAKPLLVFYRGFEHHK
jgi:hypothetical protein